MLDDVRTAWRRLRHAPGFTLAAIATLALAIGANTAILTVADAVLYRPLPYADPDRVCIIQMWHRNCRSDLVRVKHQKMTLCVHETGRAPTESSVTPER